MHSGFALRRPPRTVTIVMVTLLGVWVLSALMVRFAAFGPSLYQSLALDPAAVLTEGKIWQLLSYAVLHDLMSPGHVLFNMIGLYFFGSDLVVRWGNRRFLLFLMLAALGGASFVMVAWLLGLSAGPVVGASAVVLGLVVAWGLLYKDRTVLLFFVLPVRGIHMVWMAVAFELLSAISLGPVSAAAHFGGMATGAILVQGIWRPNRMRLFWDELLVTLRVRKKAKLYVVPKPGDDRFHIH